MWRPYPLDRQSQVSLAAQHCLLNDGDVQMPGPSNFSTLLSGLSRICRPAPRPPAFRCGRAQSRFCRPAPRPPGCRRARTISLSPPRPPAARLAFRCDAHDRAFAAPPLGRPAVGVRARSRFRRPAPRPPALPCVVGAHVLALAPRSSAARLSARARLRF
jgi:hypothetical protein